MEKFKPLYGEDGRVSDLQIAEKMAHSEDNNRETNWTGELADNRVEEVGKYAHTEKMIPVVAEKIKSMLSEEELRVIRYALNNQLESFVKEFHRTLLSDEKPEE